jgi:predicted metal-dependent phosphotriesterase family hydrolase
MTIATEDRASLPSHGTVQTVTGPVPAADLGFVLPHEHTGLHLWHIPNRWDYWELTPVDGRLIPELAAYRDAGGGTLVDVTLRELGRDPLRLRRYSEATGLRIVMGAGWYRAPYYPPEARIDSRTVEDLADELVREVELGVDGTGIRPGIIGEIGTDKPWLSALEERVHRAVARAARRTGLAIMTHAEMSPVGLLQLRVFEEEGVDPARVVIGHADSYPFLDYYLEIIRRGANVEFDFLGATTNFTEHHDESQTLNAARQLIELGHADRLLLSHDVCHNNQLRANGGNGYLHIIESFLPALRSLGVSDETIHQITVLNPARILATTE